VTFHCPSKSLFAQSGICFNNTCSKSLSEFPQHLFVLFSPVLIECPTILTTLLQLQLFYGSSENEKNLQRCGCVLFHVYSSSEQIIWSSLAADARRPYKFKRYHYTILFIPKYTFIWYSPSVCVPLYLLRAVHVLRSVQSLRWRRNSPSFLGPEGLQPCPHETLS
jgi:hypothetical protein